MTFNACCIDHKYRSRNEIQQKVKLQNTKKKTGNVEIITSYQTNVFKRKSSTEIKQNN